MRRTSQSKSTSISSYLTFNGNCRRAMTFYRNCLGGELTLQTVGESTLTNRMPGRMKESIVHATLRRDNLVLMASDMVGENGLKKGNAVSLMLDCKSEEEAREVYEKLSAGGIKTHPLEISFQGALFGDLIDKYGNHWLINFQTQKNNYEKN